MTGTVGQKRLCAGQARSGGLTFEMRQTQGVRSARRRTIASKLEQIDLRDIDRKLAPENRDHNGQANGGLRGGDSDGEED